MPAERSRLVYSTLVPSTESTEMKWSPSRVTSAVLPSGVNITWLAPEFAGPTWTLPTGVTVLPWIVNTDTEPSPRLATRASVPCRLMDRPAGEAPVSRVARTRGGFDWRSITDMRLSLTVLVRSAGSTFIAEVTRASPSSGVMATENGGPTTLAGTGISAVARGGLALRSMTVMVSGAGFWTTCTAPFTSITLLSFAEIAIWASAASGRDRVRSAVSSRLVSERIGPPWRQGWREVWGNIPVPRCQVRHSYSASHRWSPPSARWSSPAKRTAPASPACG